MTWIEDAARHIGQEIDDDGGPEDTEIATIILEHAAPLLALLRESRREHYKDHDPMDDCPALHGRSCDCGTSEWNARIDEVLK